MRKVVVNQPGGPEAMQVVEEATPQPQAGQVLVRVTAAGVNFMDIYQRSGMYQVPLPIALGAEGAGVVEAVGQGVTEIHEGDRVAWMQGPGSYASHVLQPAARLAPIPDGVSDEQAAAVLLQGVTAHVLTHRTYPLKAGERCLIHAAAGGVGLLLCQMAKMLGAQVIGTTSTEAKARLAREAGADEVILYTQRDFITEVRRITAGQGVNVVYDSVGKDTFDGSLSCLAPLGYLVLFGQSSGFVPPFEIQRLAAGSYFLTRPMVFAYLPTRQDLLRHAEAVFDWVKADKLHARIDRTYPLDEVAEAHRALSGRQTSGKVLLKP
jgi:NADPH2:quinone reductase